MTPSFEISNVLELSNRCTIFGMAARSRQRDKGVSASAITRDKRATAAVAPFAMAAAGPAAGRTKIPHPDVAAFDLATIMRTLGDPLRLQIVRVLADDRERPCGELSDQLGLPDSTSSYHLRLLREAGVTRTRAVGTQRLISLRRDDLEARFPGLVDVLTR
jgi:DNA-binding transcriptional ArsR family regulator